MPIIIILTILSLPTWAKKTFVFCSEASPTSFGPPISTSGTTNDASTHTVYSTLVQFKLGTTQIVPGLAKSWEISKDGKTYTFHLRKDVKFHTTKYFTPTRNFNAKDVLFSFNRQFQKKHPYHQVNGGSYEMFTGMNMNKALKSVVQVNDHTVVFTLNKSSAPFLATLTMGFTSIYSQEYSEVLLKRGTPEKIDFIPIGTGPFVFKKYIKDSLIRYVKNPDYFKTPAKVDQLVFAITVDSNVRYQKLKAKECHLINNPSPMDLAAMQKNPQLKVLQQEGLNVGYLAMNVSKGALSQLNVRKAIHHALNRKAYIEAIYLNMASIAKSPLPPTLWGHYKELKHLNYNPKLAKELLKKSGIKNLELELWTLPVNRPYNPNGKKMGEMMQADLAEVGIKTKLVTYDWPTYLEKTSRGEHTLAQMGWIADIADPDNFLGVLLGCHAVESGSNLARWCNKNFDKLLQKAREGQGQKLRQELYVQAQKLFKKELPWVTLAHAKVYKVMQKNIQGYVIDPLGANIFHEVSLK